MICQRYEIIKGKDENYDEIRKSLKKITSALDKISDNTCTIYFKNRGIIYYFSKSTERTYYNYDYNFTIINDNKYNFDQFCVNFNKGKMNVYSNVKKIDKFIDRLLKNIRNSNNMKIINTCKGVFH